MGTFVIKAMRRKAPIARACNRFFSAEISHMSTAITTGRAAQMAYLSALKKVLDD